jgi:hypothetical protein
MFIRRREPSRPRDPVSRHGHTRAGEGAICHLTITGLTLSGRDQRRRAKPHKVSYVRYVRDYGPLFLGESFPILTLHRLTGNQ